MCGVFYRGLKIYFKNYKNVVEDIEKQDKILDRQRALGNPNDRIIKDTYEYFQRLVNLHREFFPSAITLIISAFSLIISSIAIIISLRK